MINEGIAAGAIIGQNLIQYNRLKDITNAAFTGSNASFVNIYIDLSNILSPLFADGCNPSAMIHENEIAAGIINLIYHYRTFYWKYYQVETRFHLIWSTNCSKFSQLFCKDYNPKISAVQKYSPNKIDVILKNMKVLQDIVQYLPNVSITIGTFETGVIMNYIMNIVGDKNPNIILTKDIMTMQAVAHYPQTFAFRPKKQNGTDNSFYISPYGMGLYDYLCDLRSVQRPELLHAINPTMIGLLLSMTRVPERGMKALLTLPNALQAIDTGISQGSVLNNYNSNAITVAQGLDDKVKSRLLSNAINERFKAVDLRYQLNCYMNTPERVNFIGFQNKYEPQTLHQKVDIYFKGIEVKF